MYYAINEESARRAKEMNSFSDYIPGSATAEYRAKVDAAAAEVARHKARVDEMYHEKIDSMFDTYCRKLAENLNAAAAIDASYPSVMIAGPAGFNCRKKEKQNARRDANMREYMSLDDYLQKILSVGNGGIMSDDKRALEKLRLKVEKLEEKQEFMKAANAALRLKDTAKGDEKLKALGLSEEGIGKLRKPDMFGIVGYAAYELQNNNQNIHRLKDRITQLEKEQERAESGEVEDISGDGWTLTENAEEMRIQFIFDGKPDADTRSLLKSNGFRWAPSQGAWQRLLNDNGRYAAQRVIKTLNA